MERAEANTEFITTNQIEQSCISIIFSRIAIKPITQSLFVHP